MTTYGSDSQMTSLLDQMDVFVLPVFNIDGYVFTHTNVRYNPFKLKLFALVKRRDALRYILKNALIAHLYAFWEL